MPISCLLPSMPYRSVTNFISTKQVQLPSHPLFTKYDQQHMTTRLLRSLQKPINTTCHVNLKPDCSELATKNHKNDVHYFLQTASDFIKTQNKQLLVVIIGAISVGYSYKALAASGEVMGGDSFSSYSSSGDSWSSSSWSSSSSSSSSDTDYGLKLSKPSQSTSSKSESKYTMSTSVAPENVSTETPRFKEIIGFSLIFVSLVGIATLHTIA